MTKAERVIKYIKDECKDCKANDNPYDEEHPVCRDPECFEVLSYAIECIRKVEEYNLNNLKR